MALTINPAVSGGRARWALDASAFLLGVFVGTLATLWVVLVAETLVGMLSSARVVALVVAGLVAYASLRDLGFAIPVPYRRQQVPEPLRQMLPPPVVAVLYGAQLGAGFLTPFTYGVHSTYALAAPLLHGALLVAAAGLFALGKATVLLASADLRTMDAVAYSSPRRFHLSLIQIVALRATSLGVSAVLVLTLVRGDSV